MKKRRIAVTVAYARPDVQREIAVDVPDDATLEYAIQRSGILDLFPEIDLRSNPVGIFGRKTHLGQELREGDRVEIYRPLAITPREQRRRRAGRR